MDLKAYRKKLIGNEQERAVSPVIGVILMVAIVVILAAVIATFVLGMADDLGDSSPTTSVESNTNGDWNGSAAGGGEDVDELAYLSHTSGDTIDMDDVRVVVRDENGAQVASIDGPDFESSFTDSLDSGNDVEVVSSDDEFDAGTTLTIYAHSHGDGLEHGVDSEFQLQLIDIPSSSTVHDSTHGLPENS